MARATSNGAVFVWMVAVEARLRALVSFKLRHIRHRQRRALDNTRESPNPEAFFSIEKIAARDS